MLILNSGFIQYVVTLAMAAVTMPRAPVDGHVDTIVV